MSIEIKFSITQDNLIEIDAKNANEILIEFCNKYFYQDISSKPIHINRGEFLEYMSSFNLLFDKIKTEPILSDEFKQFINATRSYKDIANPVDSDINIEEILTKLENENFLRKLTSNQEQNLLHLCRLHAGADFSVPGAGKTTTALGYYSFHKKTDSKLLVISPINAFLSWDDEIKACLGDSNTLVRLNKIKADEIRNSLSSEFEFFIICSFLEKNITGLSVDKANV